MLYIVFLVSNPKLAHQNEIYRSRIADDTRTCDIMVCLWRVFEDGDVYCNFQNTGNFPENLNEWHCCWTTKYPGTKKTVDRVVSGGSNHVLEFSPLLEEDSHFDLYFSTGLKPPTSKCFPLFTVVLILLVMCRCSSNNSIYHLASRSFWSINGSTPRPKKN